VKYARIIAAVIDQVWAIDPVKARAMLEFLAFAAAGGQVSAEEAKKITPRREQKIANAPGGVAVIPIFGILAQHASLMSSISDPSTASTDQIGRQISAAAADPEVKAIVLRVESPGGSVYGLQEFADRIFEARQSKPVIAQVDSYAASAAYWAASQASEIVVSPGGDVGSIGVYTVHEDVSRALEAEGITETLVYSGKHKVEGNPFAPLSDEARAHLQERVDTAHQDFVAAVARGRGVDTGVVAERFGQGRMVRAEDALKKGMADRIATLDETLARFKPTPSSGRDRQRARLALASKT